MTDGSIAGSAVATISPRGSDVAAPLAGAGIEVGVSVGVGVLVAVVVGVIVAVAVSVDAGISVARGCDRICCRNAQLLRRQGRFITLTATDN
jgi:hypothetical protein